MEMERYLTVHEFALATGYAPQTITRWCRKKRLDAIQPAGAGGNWRINPKELKNKKEEVPLVEDSENQVQTYHTEQGLCQ